MNIAIAKNNEDINEALEIALNLKEYFTEEAIKNMKKDFKKDEIIVSKDKSVQGFLCFGIRDNKYEILWMAVKKNKQNQGIGKTLLDFLIQYLKCNKIKELYVKTLTPNDSYEPYRKTRKFYERYGFEHLYIEKAIKKGWDDQIVMKLTIN